MLLTGIAIGGDVDMFDNVIQINVFLGLTFAGKTLKTEAQRILTEGFGLLIIRTRSVIYPYKPERQIALQYSDLFLIQRVRPLFCCGRCGFAAE